jgi:hypothetical protein
VVAGASDVDQAPITGVSVELVARHGSVAMVRDGIAVLAPLAVLALVALHRRVLGGRRRGRGLIPAVTMFRHSRRSRRWPPWR